MANGDTATFEIARDHAGARAAVNIAAHTRDYSRVIVQPGTLIRYADLGVQINAGRDGDGRPFVSVNTEDLEPEFRYDTETGIRGNATPFYAEERDGDAVVINPQGDPIALFLPVPDIRAALDLAGDQAAALNATWADRCGLPIIAVHLNDATLYDDEGRGDEAALLRNDEDNDYVYVITIDDCTEDEVTMELRENVPFCADTESPRFANMLAATRAAQGLSNSFNGGIVSVRIDHANSGA